MPLMLVPQGATVPQSSSVCGDRATMLWECVVRIGGFGCGRSVASNWPCWPYSRSLRMGLPGSCCCASDRRGPSVDTLCLLCSSSLGRLLCVHAIFRARFFALYMQVCVSFFLSIHSNHHSPRVAANCSWPCLSDVCCPHSQKLTSVCSLGYRFVDGWPCRCSAADFWHGYKIFCYAYYSHSAPHECEFRETKLGECCPPPIFCFHLLCSLRCCLLHFNVLCVRLMSPCCGWPCRAASVALTCWPN